MTAAFNAMMAPPGESMGGAEQDEAAAAADAKRAERERPVIALITAVGSIVTGKGAVGELQQVGDRGFPITQGSFEISKLQHRDPGCCSVVVSKLRRGVQVCDAITVVPFSVTCPGRPSKDTIRAGATRTPGLHIQQILCHM